MTDPRPLIEILRARAPALRARGITHLELFGSTARRQAGADSDIDLLVELADDAPFGLFDLVELKGPMTAKVCEMAISRKQQTFPAL